MVTMKVYIDTEGFCWIVNGLNKVMEYKWGNTYKVSLKKTKKYPYEVNVPIQIIGQFVKKNETTINLYKLQQLNKESM